jgi:hypothetical protein
MSKKGIWFLPGSPDCPPDFTYTEGGRLQLGTILESFNDTTSVLFFPATDKASPSIPWPPEHVPGTEKNHEHSSTDESDAGGDILAKFLDIASVSSELEHKHKHTLKFGKVDHKIVEFQYPLSRTVVNAILAQAAIKDHTEPNIFRQLLPKPIYVVSGLRIATASFPVTEVKDSKFLAKFSAKAFASNTEDEASSPPTGGAASVPVGGKVSAHIDDKKNIKHSYETIEGEAGKGIVFAYCMYVIRRSAKMFADSSAFMTGQGDEDDIECVEVTKEMEGLDGKLIQDVRDGDSVYFPASQ